MVNIELYHHGVKGMKWGVRRSPEQLNRAALIGSPVLYGAYKGAKKVKDSGVIQRKASSMKKNADARRTLRNEKRHDKAMDVRTSAKYTYKQRKLLSDDELRARINRLNMEKQLRDLSRNEGGITINDKSVSVGREAAQTAIGKYGAKAAVTAVLGPEAGAFIRPKK
jgi:hypothetical protein